MSNSEEKSLREKINDICLRLDFLAGRVNTCKDRFTLESPYALGKLIDIIDPFIMKDLSEIMKKHPSLEKEYYKHTKINVRVQLCMSGNTYSSANWNSEKRILTIMCPKYIE